jgi:cytochrome P450
MELIKFIEERVRGLDLGRIDHSHPLGHEIDEFAEKNPEVLKGFVESLGAWAKANPGKILAVLHAVRPVLSIKSVTVITSFEGVKQILGNDSDFAVVYGPKMSMITEGAGFFLGFDDAESKGFANRTNMQMLFRRDDTQTLIRPIIDSLAQSKLSRLNPGFDLVADYLKLLPAEFAIRYFGFQQIDAQWLYRVTAGLFEYLFIDVTNNPVIAKNAESLAGEFRAKLDAEIALAAAPPTSVLGRGLALQRAGIEGFDAINLRNNLLGLLIGLVPTTAKAAAMAYDYGCQTRTSAETFFDFFRNNDFARFQAYVRELTRLNPINPGLFRKCNSTASISSGGRSYTIPAGNTVFVGTCTAMRDKLSLAAPGEIIPGRSDSAYLTYGYGLHACFGRYINDLHVAALLHNCFNSGHMVRADGADGDLHFDGAFPSSLKLKSA